jgi:hypothetical protein
MCEKSFDALAICAEAKENARGTDVKASKESEAGLMLGQLRPESGWYTSDATKTED